MNRPYLRQRMTDFRSVLWNMDDQVFVRQLLEQFVPADVKATIVTAFNSDVDRRNELLQLKEQHRL